MSSAKFVVLQKIRALRDVLFAEGRERGGSKRRGWCEVAELAQSVGLMPDKPWQYMRDTIWPNWRKRTLAKSQTCNGNSNEFDELVLEILEKPEPTGDILDAEETHNLDSLLDNATYTDTVYTSPIERNLRKRKRVSSSQPLQIDGEGKKKERMNLQIEMLKMKKYKISLEALELEMKLGLPRSEFTQGLPLPSASINSNHIDGDVYKVER